MATHRGVGAARFAALAVGPRLAQVGPSVLPSLRSVPCAADRVESDSHQLIVHLFLHRLNLLSGAVLQVLCVCWHVCSPLLMSELYIFSASLSSGLSCYLFLFFFFFPTRCLFSLSLAVSFLLSGFSASSAPSQRYSVALQLVLCSVVSCLVASSLLASVAVAVLGSLLLRSSVLSWFYPCCSGCLHPILILCVLSSSFLMFPLRGCAPSTAHSIHRFYQSS